MWIGPALLALLGVVMGIAPGGVERTVVAGAAQAVLGEPAGVHLALWHGFNPALMLSIVSVTAGVGLVFIWAALRRATPWMGGVLSWGPERGYGLILAGVNALSRAQTLVLQNGYLRVYLMVTIGTAIGLGGYTLIYTGSLEQPGSWSGVRFYQAGLAVVMLMAALYATAATSRLAAVASLSVVGYGVALIYIMFGAPDLAMTQFMVETLTVILFVLVFYHLPSLRGLSDRLTRARDAAIALVAGGFMTALVLAATADRGESELAPYYADESVPLGHGRNIVNVILVDFRALDTLGEITVLSIAAFGVFALLKLRPQSKRSGRTPRTVGRTTRGGSDAATIGDERQGSQDVRGDEA
jgi:multicomponent Na+:H+ antiporter subunit A